MPEEKILTLHPTGKKGTNILKRRYNIIPNYILNELQQVETMTFETLGNKAVINLSDSFDGKVLWYVVTVKLDLEARGKIERVPKTNPHQLRLVKQ